MATWLWHKTIHILPVGQTQVQQYWAGQRIQKFQDAFQASNAYNAEAEADIRADMYVHIQ